MKGSLAAILGVGLLLAAWAPAPAAEPGFGNLYYDGTIVRTVVPPAVAPNEGQDNFYAVMGGAAGQLGIAAVAPGDTDYHGGQWAFHRVTWNVTPYLLTSEVDVRDADAGGDVSITRVAGNDFKCPIQP